MKEIQTPNPLLLILLCGLGGIVAPASSASTKKESVPSLAPSSQREGTQYLLSPSEIADLKQWVETAKNELALLKDEIRRGNLEERRSAIIREFEAISKRSAGKENELLIRYTLNRALQIDGLLGNLSAPSELQSLVAFLESSIEVAIGFYTDDQKYLEAIGRGETPNVQTPMAVFAYQYAESVLRFSRTFLRPSLEYQLTFMALGWLANDLNSPRNLSRLAFAETINRIARLQRKFSQSPEGDELVLLKAIRDFKWEYRERVLKHVVQVNGEIRAALEKEEARKREEKRLAEITESQRQAELKRIEDERRLSETERLKLQVEREREERERREYEAIMKSAIFDPKKTFVVGTAAYLNGIYVVVRALHRDGKLTVQQNEYPYTSWENVAPTTLATIRSVCTSAERLQFCLESGVIYKSAFHTVRGLFYDGRLVVQLNDHPHTISSPVLATDLATTTRACSSRDDRYCVGKAVRYHTKQAIIRGVYPNANVAIGEWDYPYTMHSNVDIDHLALE